MSFHKILCATDFSAGAQHALRVAAGLASKSDAELVVAHAWYLPSFAFADHLPLPADTIQRLVDDEQRGLGAAAAEASRLGASHVSSRFLTGRPWAQVVEELERDPAYDLACVGTHGRTGLRRILLGSVAEKIIRHAPCSVMTIRTRDDASTFRHILVPVDFSASSRHAMELAAFLIERTDRADATIELLHVLELPVTYTGEPLVAEFVTDLDRQAAARLEQWASELRARSGARIITRARIGGPGAEVLAVLDADPSFDLVALGSHGRTGLGRLLLGSVAEKIVRHAACPVLIARARA